MEEAAKDLQDSSSNGSFMKPKELFVEDYIEEKNREITPIYSNPNSIIPAAEVGNFGPAMATVLKHFGYTLIQPQT